MNTHGLKMVGLEKAAQETMSYTNMGWRNEIFYDMATGEVWTKFQSNENNWTVYRDKNVICVGGTARHMSAQAIADMIYADVCNRKYEN